MRSLRLLALAAAMAIAAPAAALGGATPPPAIDDAALRAKVVYLTFDDGPSAPYTGRVLDALRRYRATATFFAVGTQLSAYPQLARRIVREGHVLGNHTYSHVDLTRASDAQVRSEIDRAQALIRRFSGTRTEWLRPPYGSYDSRVRSLAAQRGYRLALWDVDPQDWRLPGVSSIVATVLASTGPGDVVLLHDGGGNRSQTVAALERILPALAARGYVFKPLP